MTPIRAGIARLFRLAFRRVPADIVARDVDAEIDGHVRMRAEQFERAGLSPSDARAEAERRFGMPRDARTTLYESATHRERDMRRFDTLESWRTDIAYAARSLRREPLMTVFIIATFALGIGANAAMFGVIDRLLLSGPAHVERPDDVLRAYMTVRLPAGRDVTTGTLGYASYTALRAGARSFEDVAAYSTSGEESRGTLGRAPNTRAVSYAAATSNLFAVLGTAPALGRFFTPHEDRPFAAAFVAVISDGLWTREFGRASDVLGRELIFNDERYTVIGVAPPGFTGPELGPADVWIPMSVASRNIIRDWPTGWNAQWLHVVGRVKRGVTREVASAEVTAVHAAAYTGTDPLVRSARMNMLPLRFNESGTEPREMAISRWLLGVSVMVLVIAASNIVNLLLARAAKRRRELAVRVALGAGRARLVRLILSESVLLSLLGGVAGLGVAYGAGRLVRTVLLPQIEWISSPVSASVLFVALGAALALGVAVGLVPAVRSARANVTGDLKAGARGGGSALTPLRRTLTVAQAALSVVLLVGAGLFVRSLMHIRGLDLGFEPARVVVSELSWPRFAPDVPEAARARERARRSAVYRQIAERVRMHPGFEHASLAVGLPFGFQFSQSLRVPGWDSLPRIASGRARLSAVSDGFFATLGARIERGRAFTATDRAGSEPVAIVNRLMAETYWPGRDAVGECLYTGPRTAPCARIVGIAGNMHRSQLREEPSMQYYIPLGQEVGIGGTVLLARPRGAGATAVLDLERIVRDVDPGIHSITSETLQHRIDPQIRPWRLGATVFVLMGVLALVVAAVGLYSVMSYFVAQRAHEIAVRVALGASAPTIVRLVLGGSVALAGIGVMTGLVIALAGGRLIQPMLFDTSARDGAVFAIAAGVLLATAVFAAAGPALRARRISPLMALQDD